MGDMNCNLATSHLDHSADLLCNITDVYGLQQLINDPTRCTEFSSTLIDLIFTICPEKVVCSDVSHWYKRSQSCLYFSLNFCRLALKGP